MLQGSWIQQLHDLKGPGSSHPTCSAAHSFGFNPRKGVSWSQDRSNGDPGGVSLVHIQQRRKKTEKTFFHPCHTNHPLGLTGPSCLSTHRGDAVHWLDERSLGAEDGASPPRKIKGEGRFLRKEQGTKWMLQRLRL